jgi:arginine repressor
VQATPEAPLQELGSQLATTQQVSVSQATISRALTTLGLPRKKTFRAAEQERPEVQRHRATFQDTVKLLVPEDCMGWSRP